MDRKQIKKLIPYGYKKIVAEKAGVTNKSVSLFLNGATNSIRIEMAALEVISRLHSEKKELISKIAI